MASRTLRLGLIGLLVFSCLAIFPGFAAAQRLFFYDDPVLSDFDGDHTIDQAELLSNGTQKDIYVSFGKSSWKALTFNTSVQDRGRLFSDDVDRDGDADLIWVSQNSPMNYALWLGDGQGNFSFVAGHDREMIQTLLSINAQAHLGDNSADGEPDDALQVPTTIALQPISLLWYEISATRRTIVSPVFAHSATCISVLWKRGPPSLLS